MEKSSSMVIERLYKPHHYQELALTSDKRFIAIISGIQGGKTTCGVWWLLGEICKDKTANYIVCADSYKRLEQSTLITFFDIIPRDIGVYHKQKQQVIMPEGGIIFIRSLDDPESLEGIPDVKGIWLDEGGLTRKKAWINIQGRVARRKGRVFITTTPYAFNWLYTDFYKIWQKGNPDYLVVQFKSIANPTFPEEEYNRLKASMSEAEFKRKYDGTFSRMEGLVYELDQEDIIEEADHSGLTFYGGIDWGFTNPCALIPIGVSSDLDYVIPEEYYKRKKTTPELIKAALIMQKKYKIKLWYADPEDPEKIAQFNKAGLRTVQANNKWDEGHNAVTEVLRDHRLKVIRKGCPNTLEEFELHHYPEGDDIKGEKEKPIDAWNHALSSVRYVIVSAEGGSGRLIRPSDRKPKNQVERIEQLLSDKHKRKRVKDWYYR